MIEFRLNNRALDLPSDFVLSLTRRSPVWFGGAMEAIPGNYTLPANISATSHANRELLGYPENLANWTDFDRDYSVELWLDGNYYDTGILRVELASPAEYKIQWYSGAGFFQQFKEKTLKDYAYGGNFTLAESDLNDSRTSTGYKWVQTNFAKYIESTPTEINKYTLSYYLKEVVKYIVEEEGFSITDTLFDTAELAKVVIFHPFTRLEWTNVAAMDGFEAVPANFLPNALVKNLLNGITKTFCAGVDFDTQARRVKLFQCKDLIDGKVSDRLQAKVNGPFRKKDYEKQVQKLSFRITEPYADEPDGGQKVPFSALLTPVNAIDDLPAGAEGQWIYVYNLQAYVPYEDGEWNIAERTQYLQPYTADTEGVSIDSELVPCFLSAGYDRDGSAGYIYPITARPTQWQRFTTPDELEDSIQIGFYRGEYLGLPAVSINEKGLFGDSIGTLSLRWEGSAGLYTKHWAPWVNFLANTCEVEVPMIWAMPDLFNFDWTQKYRIWDEHSGTYQLFFVKEQKIVVGLRDGIREADQTLVQIRG